MYARIHNSISFWTIARSGKLAARFALHILAIRMAWRMMRHSWRLEDGRPTPKITWGMMGAGASIIRREREAGWIDDETVAMLAYMEMWIAEFDPAETNRP